MHDRIGHCGLLEKRMSAEAAAVLINPGMTVAMSGFTGASRAPELDGVLAKAGGIELRLQYMSDPALRKRINDGELDYMDIYLSHVAQHTWFGFCGAINIAIIEGVGILEVNSQQSAAMEGMHDIYFGTAQPPHRKPIQLTDPEDRIGVPYLHVDADKIIAIVETDAPDRLSAFAAPDEASNQIATHLLDFLDTEIAKGHMTNKLLPLQSGVGSIANAVLAGLSRGGYRGLKAYTEVIQDGMLELFKDGTLAFALATSFSLSEAGIEEFNRNVDFYCERIVFRTQEISNHPELIRRLGCIALNGMIEADIYGNVNSTHVDHTEHDTMILITEQGLADLRGLAPKQRAWVIVEKCAHPDYKPMLEDYFERASRDSYGKHTPHLMGEALSWHQRYIDTGDMRP
ncbi:acetyl-CoA hydrolase/transferase C-terminal domain-containing protein [Arthrobacter sp. TMN-49]